MDKQKSDLPFNQFANNSFLYQNRKNTIPESIEVHSGDKKYQLNFKKVQTHDPEKYPNFYEAALLRIDPEKEQLLFNTSWNRFRYDGNQLELISPNKQHLFIPLANRILFDVANEKMIYLQHQSGALIGNIFYQQNMLLISDRALTVTNYETEMSSSIYFDDGTKIKWAEINNDGYIIYATEDAPDSIKKVKYRTFDVQKQNEETNSLLEKTLLAKNFNDELRPKVKHYNKTINGKKYAISINGSDEPNNGRMVTLASFFIDEEDQNKKYRSSYWKYDLGNHSFFSKDEKYILIPYEAGARIFYTADLYSFLVPTSTFSRGDGEFQSHRFLDDIALIYMEKSVHICNLKTKMSERISFSSKGSATFMANKNLVLSKKDKDGKLNSYLLYPTLLN